MDETKKPPAEAARPVEFRGRVYESILDTIGATPLVRLRKLRIDLHVEHRAKPPPRFLPSEVQRKCC